VRLPDLGLPGGAHAACGSTQLAAGSGFGLVIAGGQDTAGAQNPVGAFPEVS
jgi:hypothetical protein